jgi:hypothetical protein
MGCGSVALPAVADGSGRWQSQLMVVMTAAWHVLCAAVSGALQLGLQGRAG